MSKGRPLAAALTCTAVLGLSGCVAAAIPVLAGGALARSASDGRDARAKTAALDEAQSPAVAAPAVPEAGVAMSGKLEGAADRASPVVARFVNHVRTQTSSSTPPLSAMLREPAALDAERLPCNKTAPTVLIDVDPAGARYAPGMSFRPLPDLAAGLADLRASGVAVAWISEASAAHAGDLRMELAESGLDPAGRDTLLLMRYPDDREQTRRRDIAESACLIAIAGDERADFDELYDHLVHPDAALALERLIGQGWFLLPGLTAPNPASPTLAAKDTPEP